MPLDFATAAYEASSPSLLASQDPAKEDDLQRPGRDWQTIYTHLEARLGALKNWRWSWWAVWASLAEFILPRRYRWLVTANTFARGQYLNNAIVDETGTQAMYICASGCWSGLTSPTKPWFEFGVQPEFSDRLDAPANAWIELVQNRLYSVLDGSNFYTQMAQAFQDISTFGTAPILIYEHVDSVIHCALPCAGEYCLAVNATLKDDTLYREYTMTVGGIVDMFTLAECPAEIKKAWAEGGARLEVEYVVCHAVEPNFRLLDKEGKASISVVPQMYAFREVYWLRGKKTEAELSRKGFFEQPFAAMRWSTVSNDAYGRGPGHDNLGSIKQLQQETRRKAEFIEKLIRPPMGGDPALKNEPASINPGALTYVDSSTGKKGLWALFEVNPAALQPMSEDLKEIRQRIKDGFFVNIFMAISQMEGVQPKNELELTKRDLERLQMLGPFIELFETETAAPLLKRVLGIMSRRGMIPPRPASLQGIPVKITFVSILRTVQLAAETAIMERTAAFAGNLSAAAKAAQVPDPIRIINLDQLLRQYARKVNFPGSVLFSADEVKEHDQERAQNMQQQQAMAATLPGVQAAKTLGETQIGGGQTALAAMLGNQGGA